MIKNHLSWVAQRLTVADQQVNLQTYDKDVSAREEEVELLGFGCIHVCGNRKTSTQIENKIDPQRNQPQRPALTLLFKAETQPNCQCNYYWQ